MRPRFSIDLIVPGEPADVWRRLWDLDRHTAAVPLTTATGGPLGPGVRFRGRTGVGPLGFDDVMVVRGWEEPRHAVVDKVGPVLRGTIEATLEPVRDGTLLRWRQSFGATFLPDRVVALAGPVVRTGYLGALRRITAP